MNKLIAIAINQYTDPQIPKLTNCLSDVNAIIDILTQSYKFERPELYAEKKATTLIAIYNNLYDELINAMEEDSILIYFAGHGEYNPYLGTSYWMCSDSAKANVTSWFNIDILNSFFKASKARHIALISDSCFSGAIFEKIRGGGIHALQGKISRQVLTSGGIETVLDGTDAHSQFNLAVQKVLRENDKPNLSFYELSEQVILHFDQNARQTPEFGGLHASGHNGGTFIFELNTGNPNILQDIQLPLELPKAVNITSDIKLPFFNKNTQFDNTYINTFIQSLGYTIINDVRSYALNDLEYAIERSEAYGFEVEVSYTIEYFDEKYLSIKFSHYSEMGGMHPNHYVYALNFSFSPERKIALYEIIDTFAYQNLKELLTEMINQYGNVDDRELLKQCLDDHDYYDLPFSFTSAEFTIYWFNLLPHAFKGHGLLTIPIKEIDKLSSKLRLG
jgi:hypothetical protein